MSLCDRVGSGFGLEGHVLILVGFPGLENRSPIAANGAMDFLAAVNEVARCMSGFRVDSPRWGYFRVGQFGIDRHERVDGDPKRAIKRIEDREFRIASELVRRHRRVRSQRPLRPRALRRGRSVSGGAKVSR